MNSLRNSAEYIKRGNVLLKQDIFSDAEKNFSLCLKSDPENIEAMERYAYVAMKRKNFDSAYVRYAELIKAHPDNCSGYIGLGNVLLAQDLIDEAAEVFERCIKLFPDHHAAMERYAYIAFVMIDYERAYERYKKIIKEYPDRVTGYIGAGNVFLYQNLFDEAEDFFSRCVIDFPDNLNAHRQYIYVAFKKMDFEAAYNRIVALISGYPEYLDGQIKYIEILILKKLYDEAENAIKKLLDKYPDCFNVYNDIIRIHNKYIKDGIYYKINGFTDLCLKLYNDIEHNMKNVHQCFDNKKLLYGALLGAKNINDFKKIRKNNNQLKNTIAIFGDSSITTTLYNPEYFKKLGINVDFFHLSGATITGFGKDSSKLGTYEFVKDYVRSRKPQYLVLKFGQGDLEFGYYYRVLIKNEQLDYQDFLFFLIESYKKRIHQLKDLTNVIVHGIDFPSLIEMKKCAKRTLDVITRDIDGRTTDIVLLKKLLSIQPSIEQRTVNALLLNSMLKDMSNDAGCLYADTKNIFLHKDRHILDSYYQPYFDHHYLSTDILKEKCIDEVFKKYIFI